MPSFNKVMMIGNLTRDPQQKYVAGGKDGRLAVAEFGLAMNRKYRTAAGEDRDEVCFVDCTAFGRQAETIGQFCKKGKSLFVEGRLKFDAWEQDGQKRSRLTVIVENFQFLGPKDDPDSPAGAFDAVGRDAPRQSAPPPQRQQAARPPPTRQQAPARPAPSSAPAPAEPPFGDEAVFTDDQIPF